MSSQPRSTTKKYDVAGVIGRFQGVQEGHLNVLATALGAAERVKVLIGSANVARDTRNPFTYSERRNVLEACVAEKFPKDVGRVTYAGINDTPYDKPAWITRINNEVRAASDALRPRIALVGNIRDQTSEYLTWFPAWDYLPVTDSGSNATALRKAFFAGSVNFNAKGWEDAGFDWSRVPQPTIDFLQQFRGREVYPYLMKQLAAEAAYKKQWGPGPFQTVDPVIIKGDHLLMIERGGLEGTGSIGLPGGFLNPGERLLWAAAREGIEETGLFISDEDMPAFEAYLQACHQALVDKTAQPPTPAFMTKAIEMLVSYQKGDGVRFDDPNRSRRGHLITEAFLFQLPDGHGLPRVKGMDDAKAAFWKPTSEVRPAETFEDHAHIADFMISRYATF